MSVKAADRLHNLRLVHAADSDLGLQLCLAAAGAVFWLLN